MPAEQPQSRVRISGPVALMRELFRTHPLEPQSERRIGEQLTFEAFASDSAQKLAIQLGLQVEVLVTAADINRRRDDVHTGNRFKNGAVPRGYGRLLEKRQ